MVYQNNLNDPGRMRPGYNIIRLRQKFRKNTEQNRQKSLSYMNSENFSFPFLFALIPEIETLNLYENLCPRNIIALKTCAGKLDNQNLGNRVNSLMSEDDNMEHQALKWMFTTGINWNGSDEDYDMYNAVLDAAAALLIITYKDKTILPAVADLIFKRNRKGLLIHDLVWSFFQAFDPDSLSLVADYLLSSKKKDVELACKLLHLQKPEDMEKRAVKRKIHNDYLLWLNENSPYLYLTGEHFQLTSDPNPLNVDLDAKYLCKKISPKNREPLAPLTENEIVCLRQFREASEPEQEILSKYSRKIHEQDIHSWNQWIKKQLNEQLNIAKASMEAVQ